MIRGLEHVSHEERLRELGMERLLSGHVVTEQGAVV